MDLGQDFTQQEQAEALSKGLCPRCKGPIQDLRDCGFNASQVRGCFLFAKGSWQCRGPRKDRDATHE